LLHERNLPRHVSLQPGQWFGKCSYQSLGPAVRTNKEIAVPDPVKMLKTDHDEVKKMFADFEKGDGRSRPRIAQEAMMELEIHTKLEEQIFYPALEKEKSNEEMMAEAEEEHHVADMLIKELKSMDRSSDDVTYDAKFTVLMENVKHHIKEEETEMLPKAAKLPKDQLEQLGTQMEQLKTRLKSEMKGAKTGSSAR
jgi:hemerythrin HHE cation binding domain-containing protein